MTTLKLCYETVDPFTILLRDFLSSRGIAPGDVTDIVFSAKDKVTDLDIDARVIKTKGAGDIVMGVDGDGLDTIAVTLAYSDYGPTKLAVGGDYFIGIGFKTAIHTKWLEGKWLGDGPKLRILQDFYRD